MKKAYNNFIKGCKDDGIWDAIKASCILAGARTLTGALVPLKGTAPTSYNFVGGTDYDRETGLVGDGTSKYLDSNRNNNSDGQNNKHLSIYITQPSSSNALHIGCGGFGQTGSSHLFNSSIGSYAARIHTSVVPISTIAYSNNPTFLGASRSESSGFLIRALNQTVTESYLSQNPLNQSITVFRSDTFYSALRISFYSIGESLDLAKLDSRVSTLMTELAAAIP